MLDLIFKCIIFLRINYKELLVITKIPQLKHGFKSYQKRAGILTMFSLTAELIVEIWRMKEFLSTQLPSLNIHVLQKDLIY